MCYSAMVNQNSKSLGINFQARVDLALMSDIFQRRLDGEKISISKGFERNFQNPVSPIEKQIWSAILEFQKLEGSALETELFDLKRRLGVVENKLLQKVTKTAEKEKAVVLRQLERKMKKLENLHRTNEVPTDNRIYPFTWTTVIIQKAGERIVSPMRYHLRPPGKPAKFDVERPGCYNARRDNLNHFWKKEFGKKHGLIVISSFFENVSKHVFEKRPLAAGETEANLILQFTPTGVSEMYVPIIWDTWVGDEQPSFDGFAMITDDPPPEISEAGHDRCPVFLKPENIQAWLAPEGRTEDELFGILADPMRPIYKHQIAA